MSSSMKNMRHPKTSTTDIHENGGGGAMHGGGGGGMMASSSSAVATPTSPASPVSISGGMGGGHSSTASAPPLTTTSNISKNVANVRLQLLDDSITVFQIQTKSTGRTIFDQFCKQLNLLEVDYFGMEYSDYHGVTYWLDLEKQMCHQVGLFSPSSSLSQSASPSKGPSSGPDKMNQNSEPPPLLRFCVKFYTPDPTQIEEEYTRYLYGLQIKRDLRTGALPCNENTAALMASYIVQAECGDYAPTDYPDHTYLSTFKFVPEQDSNLERKIMENHKQHIGQTPAEADLNLLETARRCELYGTKLHLAKDHEGVPLNLSVIHSGVAVFQNLTKINAFSWAKIRKVSFKRKKFLIKLHPEGYGYFKDTVEFYFEDRNHCKNFWKKCVEHHSFFRCFVISPKKSKDREKHRILSRGSSFRYSGKTQKQLQEYVRENFVKRQSFQRHVRNLHGSASANFLGVAPTFPGSSAPAQPLLPIGDNNAVGDKNGNVNPEEDEDPHSAASGHFEVNNREGASRQTSHQGTPLRDISAGSLGKRFNNNTTMNGEGPSAVGSSGGTWTMEGNTRVINNSVDGTLSPGSSKSAGTDPDIHGQGMQGPDVNGTPPPRSTSAARQRSASRKRQGGTIDRSYYIAKEFVMTERTYKKDLEIINLWFRDEVSKEQQDQMPEDLLNLLFSHLDPIYEVHCRLLKETEANISSWETSSGNTGSGNRNSLGNILLRTFDVITLDHYLKYLDIHSTVITQMAENCKQIVANSANSNNKFLQACNEFETQKVCYLPLMTLLLKPLHRILHYELLLERMLGNISSHHPDSQSTNLALIKIQSIVRKVSPKLEKSENFVKLAELERDFGGTFEGGIIIQPRTLQNNQEENCEMSALQLSDDQSQRLFLREGCLQKFSRRGYQQRMFFLFDDVLVYTNRSTHPSLHFKVHGSMAVKDLSVLDSEPRMNLDYCFNVYDGKRALLVAAASPEEKLEWMEDISEAAQMAKMAAESDPSRHQRENKFSSLKSMGGSEDGLDRSEASSVATTITAQLQDGPGGHLGTLGRMGGNVTPLGASGSGAGSTQLRNNSSVHVCWHRSTTMAKREFHFSLQTSLSGYLLRKFKNSNGWQKLWVVYTNSCLFFYKTFEDDFPLASLPLLGYIVQKPNPEDGIHKDFVFKLQFKNHVYFFRTESHYSFERWIEVLSVSTLLSDELLAETSNLNHDGGRRTDESFGAIISNAQI